MKLRFKVRRELADWSVIDSKMASQPSGALVVDTWPTRREARKHAKEMNNLEAALERKSDKKLELITLG